jgi:hypothetical protein
VDDPVAASAEASATLRAFADAGACDIGAHLHPWVTPPDATRVPPQLSYPGNLPAAEEFAKLEMLTHTIQAAFGRRPTIYKAGRYGVGPATANALRTLGYQVDISLVPHTDFSADGGPDFAALGHLPVRFTQGIVGLPLSTGFAGHLAPYGPALFRHMESATARRLHLPGIAARLGLLERLRLSPEGHGFDDMLRQVRAGLRQGVRLFMLTYHSSSLLPGATPYVRDEQARAAFLATLDRFLGAFLQGCGGKTETVAAMAARLARQAA